MPGLTVCFDALGSSFSFEPMVDALEEVMGEELRQVGSGARMTVMDWFHAAQRDYVYLSVISPPPPPISQILKLTLPRSILYALKQTPSLDRQLPDLTPVTDKLTALIPAPTLKECFSLLKAQPTNANILLITNGAKATTQGYVDQAGLTEFVDAVKSCDEVGLSKPFAKVYENALKACDEVEKGDKATRWFVAAHMWDLCAARKAGFKTGVVLAEQPPVGKTSDGKDAVDDWWGLYGGKPDVVGATLEEVAQGILAYENST